MPETTFGLKYEGPALSDGRMPIRDLAPALLALGDLFQDAAAELYPELPAPALEIEATKEGSFEVHLILSNAAGAWGQIVNAFSSNGITALVNLQAVVIGGRAIGLFDLIPRLAGRTVKADREGLEEGTKVLTLDDESEVEVQAGCFRLYRSRRIRRSAKESVAPLKVKGVEALRFQAPDEEPTEIRSSAVAAFELPPSEEDVDELTDEERTMVLSILSLSFTEGNKWRVSDGENVFSVAIEDEDFIARVNRREEHFAKGDMLRCKVRLKQSTDEGRLRTEYRLVEILDRIDNGEQLGLSDHAA